VSRRRLKLSQARSLSGVQVTSGTRVGVITGTGEVATTTGGGLDLTPIQTRIGGRDGGVAGPVTVGGSMTTMGSVTTVGSMGPVTTAAPVVTTAGLVVTTAGLVVTTAAPVVTTAGLVGPVVANSTFSAGDGHGGLRDRHLLRHARSGT
jgi:hypothetical protein